MNYNFDDTLTILERTPGVLKALLHDLPESWVKNNEGDGTWSPYDIVGHLIHGEKTDWMARLKIILYQENRPFDPFDRFAQFENSKGKTLEELLEEFELLRNNNLKELKQMEVSLEKFNLEGRHPELGTVTLQQLLATWVTHDLSHLSQITRVMAKQYDKEVGPWKEYLGILNR